MEDKRTKRRRSFFVEAVVFSVLFLTLPLLLTVSVVVGLGLSNANPWCGWELLLPAGVFSLLNFYLSFVRPIAYRLRHHDMSEYKFVSGIPLFGPICLAIALLLCFGAVGTSTVGLAFCFVDTLGPIWLAVALLRELCR